MLAFSALIAGSFSFGGRIANLIDPVALTTVRFVIATAIIAAVVAMRGGIRRADLAAPWRYVVIGGLMAIYFVLMFEGLKTASPVSTSAVFTLAPIFAAGFGWLLLRQVTTARMALALTIGGLGALWVIFRADISALLALELGRGEGVFLIGVVAHAAYTPMVRRLNRGESPLVFTLGMLIAALVVLIAYGSDRVMATDWAALPAVVWAVTLYLAVFASATTFVLVQYATLRLPSAKVMAYTYLTPSWVIGWELILGAKPPPTLILAGIALTLVALWLLLAED
ncbi:DMT family transporter [Actibacterium mucosum]|nr:DMT family transporter [Actibacterium mucosum]